MSMYLRFGAMVATSTVIMFVLMYLNTYQLAHLAFSETRTYMALLMGATMAVIMLAFMTHMLQNWRANVGIVVASVGVFALSLWLVRSQRTVEDVSYMRAMIPHHSIAILTSERAQISDSRVRTLADGIIQSQRREIAEMKALIDDIESAGHPSSAEASSTEASSTEQAETDGPTATALLYAPQIPSPDATAVQIPVGFRAEVVLSGLTYPTSVEFDEWGVMYVAEAGYSYGDQSSEPRIWRVSPQGEVSSWLEGEPLRGPINDLLWHAE